MYGNRLDNLINNSSKKVFIWPVKNTKGPQIQLAQLEDRVTGNFELEEEEKLEEMIKDRTDISTFIWRS